MWGALVMLAAAAVAVLYVVLAATSKPQQSTGYARFAQGGVERLVVMEDAPPMPGEALRDGAGAPTSLAALTAGEVSLVNLWATWCAPCREEMPTLAALSRRFEGRGLNVIAVSADGDAQVEEAKAELSELTTGALDFYNDPTRAVLFSAQARGLPLTILYGRDGRERARVIGQADWESEEAAALVEAALAEAP